MESALPSQTTCLAGLTPEAFGMLKLGGIIFVLGLKKHHLPQDWKHNKKTDTVTTGLKIKDSL